jgi:hypothetical protein
LLHVEMWISISPRTTIDIRSKMVSSKLFLSFLILLRTPQTMHHDKHHVLLCQFRSDVYW